LGVIDFSREDFGIKEKKGWSLGIERAVDKSFPVFFKEAYCLCMYLIENDSL